MIVFEGVIHLLFANYLGKKLSQTEMNAAIIKTSGSIIGSAAFGVLIIVVVFVPIMTLSGIEGKMFTPMAQTVSFAILGALFLSVTYVPMMTSLFLKKEIKTSVSFADKLMNFFIRSISARIEFCAEAPESSYRFRNFSSHLSCDDLYTHGSGVCSNT